MTSLAMSSRGSLKHWHHYANTPLFEESTRNFAPLLRSFAQQRLPDYMVPAEVILIQSVPLTPSGKIDRRALAQLEVSRTAAGIEIAGPRTRSLEQELVAGIWAEVLGVEEVGLDDNFFDLGGHSLLATQVISRAREVFKVELSVRSLFEQASVRDFSELVSRADEAAARSRAA